MQVLSPLRLATLATITGVIIGFAGPVAGSAASDEIDELSVPGEAMVVGTSWYGLRVRTGPGLDYGMQTVLRDGTKVRVLEGPVSDGWYEWYRIGGYDGSGRTGWSVSQFLAPPAQYSGGAYVSSGTNTNSAEGRTFTATITAYAHRSRTATGSQVRWGVVAVDPRYIPLGTRLRIEGFDDVFVAEDTGGGIRGHMIDIWFPDVASALRFGVRQRLVTLLLPGED